MLKVAIENSYVNNYKGKDEFGSKKFMQDIFKENDIELVRVSMNKMNKKNEFTEYNIITNNGNSKVIKKTYKPDIIRSRRGLGTYYKYSKLSDKYIITPSQKISTISNDKYETYLFCKEFQPKTQLLRTFLSKKNNDFSSEKLIIKPLRANGGKGIKLTSSKEIIEGKKKFIGIEELYIVQEFKDFSGGYPGIVEGNHDIRLMFAGKEIIETTLRIPKKGGFKSNIGSGGTQHILEKKKLPKELINLSKKIYKQLQLKGNDIMSMDFAYCKSEKKRYLIEINASPGTRYYQENKKELEKICLGLIKFFKKLKK